MFIEGKIHKEEDARNASRQEGQKEIASPASPDCNDSLGQDVEQSAEQVIQSLREQLLEAQGELLDTQGELRRAQGELSETKVQNSNAENAVFGLKVDLATLQQKNEILTNDFARVKARSKEQEETMKTTASAEVILSLLPVLDSIDTAPESDENVKAIGKQLEGILASKEVKRTDPMGQEFDPMQMEAVMMQPGKDQEVIRVFSSGWTIGENLLRPAKVVVGQGE